MSDNTTQSQSARLRPLFSGIAALALTLVAGLTASADDTEILVGNALEFAKPNILFIIDTSGSMDSELLVDDSYDPGVVYTGPFNDTSRFYYGAVDFNGAFDFPDVDFAGSGNYVDSGSFACDAAEGPLNIKGFHIDFYAQFNPSVESNVWGPLVRDTGDGQTGFDRFTECLSDEGIHGANIVLPEAVYTVDGPPSVGAVPWTADPDDPMRFDFLTGSTRWVFFHNNYLNWIVGSRGTPNPVVDSRLSVVQDVATGLVDRLTNENADQSTGFNVGVMRFSTNGEGGMVVKELTDISSQDNANDVTAALNALSPSSSTPLAETLFEAYKYLVGNPVVFGATSEPTLSVAAAQDGSGNYISPITASCQKNYVVLLTDGLPTSDTDANAAIENLTGACVGNCLDELARLMDETDLSTLPERQSAQTYTIGFFTDSNLLRDAATGVIRFDADGNELDPPQPGYFTADNVEGLQTAFATILQSIVTDVDTFTSPATSVNSLNRLTNRDVLYFTMFDPAAQGQPHWDGNLKAYFIGRPDNAGPDADITILDANRSAATDEDGVFKPNARSIWSQSADGGIVTEGGVASLLSDTRTVVSNIAGGSLFSDDNRVHESNSNITTTDLAVATAERRTELLRFARGLDEDGNARKILGDPLHTEPLVVTYGGGSEELRLFFTTNDGYFHAIDPTPVQGYNGDLEEFAFIPRELLDNLDIIERNQPASPGTNQKVYGLDGPITSLITGDQDFVVDGGEQLFVYFGMRRGGLTYYALDFGTGGQADPRVAWTIKRGDSKFARLGQTWSAATPAKINFNGTAVDVLIFGGGYDPSQDTSNSPNPSMGNAVYIVDAKTGTQLWRASNESGADLTLEEMEYPIPSDVSVLDIDGDGLADRLYVGDMGGQVFRFDVRNGTSTTEISGAVFADLGESGASGERRFYNRPSVARIFNDDDNFLAIAIGSGFRAHPLGTANDDRFYLLKDINVFAPQTDGNGVVTYPAPLTNDDLVEITGEATSEPGIGGWYLPLTASAGEKNLSEALIVQNQVFFTTYSPEASSLSCQPNAAVGTGRLYAVSIFSGLPVLFDDGQGDPLLFTELDRTGIPPAPTLIFTEPACSGPDCYVDDDPDDDDVPTPRGGDDCFGAASEVTMLVAAESFNPKICTAPQRTYWFETDVDADDL